MILMSNFGEIAGKEPRRPRRSQSRGRELARALPNSSRTPLIGNCRLSSRARKVYGEICGGTWHHSPASTEQRKTVKRHKRPH